MYDIQIKAEGSFEGGLAALPEQLQHQAEAEYRAFLYRTLEFIKLKPFFSL